MLWWGNHCAGSGAAAIRAIRKYFARFTSLSETRAGRVRFRKAQASADLRRIAAGCRRKPNRLPTRATRAARMNHNAVEIGVAAGPKVYELKKKPFTLMTST